MRKLRSKKEYEAAMILIEAYFHARKGTKSASLLMLLVELVNEYEDKHYPIHNKQKGVTNDRRNAIQKR